LNGLVPIRGSLRIASLELVMAFAGGGAFSVVKPDLV